jgi:hypothetical protein
MRTNAHIPGLYPNRDINPCTRNGKTVPPAPIHRGGLSEEQRLRQISADAPVPAYMIP